MRSKADTRPWQPVLLPRHHQSCRRRDYHHNGCGRQAKGQAANRRHNTPDVERQAPQKCPGEKPPRTWLSDFVPVVHSCLAENYPAEWPRIMAVMPNHVAKKPAARFLVARRPAQLSSWRSRLRTSPSMSASRWRKSSINLTAWITVEWSRPPNLRPISG